MWNVGAVTTFFDFNQLNIRFNKNSNAVICIDL